MDINAFREVPDGDKFAVALKKLSGYSLVANGNTSSPLAGPYSIVLTGGSDGGVRGERMVVPPSTNQASKLVLSGSADRWANGYLNTEVVWNNQSLTADYTPDNKVKVSIPEKVTAALPETAGKGSVYLNDEVVATLSLAGSNWTITLPSLEVEPLF